MSMYADKLHDDAPLSVELLEESAGDEELRKLNNLEIIFSHITSLDNLDQCPSLKVLTLIDNGLLRISNLLPIADTLQRLSLCGQNLRRIEGLEGLHQLRELYLTNNQISRIENLEGCPHLQTLWLHSNQITVIENLDNLYDLRELWLQDNQIRKITGVDKLVNLHVLHLAANEINDFKDLQTLAKLPTLTDVSFADRLFGTCPLALQDGYRNFVIFYLKQIRVLDRLKIDNEDRATVDDMYLRSVLEFNDKVETIKREGATELRLLDQRRIANEQNAELLKKNLVNALLHLEKVVTEGRAKIVDVHSQQCQVRRNHKKKLKGMLSGIREDYSKAISNLVASETVKMEQADKFYEQMQQRAELELADSKLLLDLETVSSHPVFAQDLLPKSTEYRFVKTHFDNENFNSGDRATGSASAQFRITKIYRIYGANLEKTFASQLRNLASIRQDPKFAKLYMCFSSQAALKSALQHGMEQPPPPQGPVLHCSAARAVDAMVATRQAQGEDKSNTSITHGSFMVLLCRVALGKTVELPNQDGDSALYKSASLEAIPADALSGVLNGRDFVLRDASQVLPEYYMRIESCNVHDTEMHLENAIKENVMSSALHPVTLDSESLKKEYKTLHQLEEKASSEFRKYQETLWSSLSPDLGPSVAEGNDEVHQLESTLAALKRQIAAERGVQEQIVKSYKNAVNSSGELRSGKGSHRTPSNSSRNRPPSGSRSSRK